MKFRSPRFRAPALAALITALIAPLLGGCGQNPGQTGIDYVEQQGIRVTAPLYHLTFDDLPVDSVFGAEVPLNHFGESLLVVGRESDYIARARLGFQITTKSQRDSLAVCDSLTPCLHLRLSALPLGGFLVGKDYLRSAAQNRDTLALLVESFSWPDSTGSFSDSLNVFHRRILTAPVPFSTLDPQFKRLDTIRVFPSRAYPDTGIIQDSSQAGALPHLWERLRTGGGSDTARRWTVYLEISPLTPADSGMFRFISQSGGNSTTIRRYNSGLWLGRYNPDSLLTVGTLLAPYRSGFGAVPAANYETRHTGTSTRSLLHGVARGVHLRINRDTLIERIRLKLNALDTTGDLGDRLLGAAPSGTFDRRFFVPYAALSLPVDTALTRVQGPFALDVGITSDVDSLGDDTAAFRDDITVGVGNSIELPVQGGGTYSSVTVDNLVVSYRAHPVDTALRQILFHWAGAPSPADTFTVTPDGLRRDLTMRRRSGWLQATTLAVNPGPSQLRVEVYFSVAGVIEPNHLLNADGRSLTSPSSLKGRFWRPGADSLNVRATRGVRNLLNRAHVPGTGVAPDMFLETVRRAAYDTSSYSRVSYPVFGEIDFRRAGNGRLEVGLDLYLYPLEAGQ